MDSARQLVPDRRRVGRAGTAVSGTSGSSGPPDRDCEQLERAREAGADVRSSDRLSLVGRGDVAQFAVCIPGPQRKPRRGEAAVDEQRGVRGGLAHAVCGRERAVLWGDRLRPRLQAPWAVARDARDLLLAEGLAQVLEGRAIADARAEQAGAVVGDDRLALGRGPSGPPPGSRSEAP